MKNSQKNVSYDSFIHDVATLGTLDSTTRPQMRQVGTLPGGQFMKFQYLEPWPSGNKYAREFGGHRDHRKTNCNSNLVKDGTIFD